MRIITSVKHLLRIPAGTVKLPKHIDELYRLRGLVDELHPALIELAETNRRLIEQTSTTERHATSVDTRLTQLVKTVEAMRNPQQTSLPISENQSASNRFSDNHDLDDFYLEFENEFRGSPEDIKARVSVYPTRFKQLGVDFDKYPVIDIGCGRGELIASLYEHGVRTIGLDVNHAMVKEAQGRGFEAHQGDALTYLRSLESNSVGGITGMHIVEHLPFSELIALFKECYRVIVPGGAIIFETPNPENLIVGIYGFYMDPSHLNPLPPPLLDFAVRHTGFIKTEILYQHPSSKEQPVYNDPMLDELANRIYGAFDYAVVGVKPGKDELKKVAKTKKTPVKNSRKNRKK